VSNVEWADRWTAVQGQQLAVEITDRLRTSASLDDLPLARTEGRVDLRGFSTRPPESVSRAGLAEDRGDGTAVPLAGVGLLDEVLELHDVALSSLDLRHSRLPSLRFFEVAINDCRFDDAHCRDWRVWGFTVTKCSFRNTDFRDSAIGTWWNGKASAFRAVDFSGADLRALNFDRAEFIDCTFDNTRLDTVRFDGCALHDCTFTGPINEVIFTGGRLERVSFAAAELRLAEFHDVALDEVVLPSDREAHVVVHRYPCVVRRTLARLESSPDEALSTLRARLQVDAQRLADERDIGLWHRSELGPTESTQAAARELLEAVERECRAEEET
jgi:uncharacterized protein YjbI with pentapeptide repeats